MKRDFCKTRLGGTKVPLSEGWSFVDFLFEVWDEVEFCGEAAEGCAEVCGY